MEDAQCLLDVISDPLALNAFLEQEQNAAKQRQNAQFQNVTHAAGTQPGASLAGHQYLIKQQQLQHQVQQPQTTANQITILGSPMPPPSQSPMAPSPMNLPVGSPLVAHGSPMMAHGSPMTMVARSPQQPPSPQVQNILQQVPSPVNSGTRTNSPMMMRQPQLLPKPTMNTTAMVQQQASVGQPTLQIQKALGQNVTQSLTIPVQIPPGLSNKLHGTSNTLHYQPQATTSMISTIQNSTPINLQGSTIIQTSSGKFLLPSGVQLQNLQQFLTSPQGGGQQIVLQNQIVQNTQQAGLGINTNANVVNYSQQPSQIVIQSAGGSQQGNIILRTLPSVLQTANQTTGNSVQNGQKTILIAPQQNLGQFQTTAGAVSLNQQTNVNLLSKTMPMQNGNVIVNINGQNTSISLQQLRNLQGVNVAGSNKLSNLNIQFSQANVSSMPQMATVQSQPATDSTNQTVTIGNQIYINHLLNQAATKTSASVSNPITNTTTSQLVSNVIAAQSKILAAKASSKKQIQIQRAGEANRRSPGTKSGARVQVTSNQSVTNSYTLAQAQADNILSQAISICNLEIDSTKNAGLVSNTNSTSKTLTVPSSQFGSVPTPVSRRTVPSTAVNVSNLTFSRVIPSVSSTAVTFNSSAAGVGSFSPSTVNSLYQNHNNFASSVATIFSSPSNVHNTLSSSLSLSNPPMSTTVTNSSYMAAKPVMSQLDVKPLVTQFLDVKPVVSQLDVKPVFSQFVDVKPTLTQVANVKPAVSQYATVRPVVSQFMVATPQTTQLDVKPVLSQLNVQQSLTPTPSTLVLQCAQSNVSLSTAITTIAGSKITQCPTISSSTAVPISSTLENNTPPVTQVHLSPQAQVALQTVQAQLKILLTKERTPEEDVRLQKLYEVQRKIIAHGHQNALKRQEQLNKLVANTPTVAFASPQTSVVSQPQVTDAKTAIAGIQNMHNVPAPNVTILKSGPIATVAETKTSVIPTAVQVFSQGNQGVKAQTIAKVEMTDKKSLAVPTQVKVANHIISVNLTPEQKAKFEEQLAKLTPEQQEVFYKHQVSIQLKQNLLKQQQMQAQNMTQIKQEPGALKQTGTTSVPGMVTVTVEQVAPGITQIKPIITTSPSTTTFTSNRGIKRISTGAISRTSLLHQQLHKDQAAVLAPNCTTPFSTPNDACRRLLRYHVYHEKEPPSFIRQKEENNFEEYSSHILQKGRKMLDWYQMLLLDESMRAQPTSELVMMERMFLQEEREQLANDRRRSKEDPDNFIPTPVTTHTEPDVVEVPPSTTTTSASFTTPATSSSAGWMSTNTHGLNKVAPASNAAYSQNSNIPKEEYRSTEEESIPTEKPKLGVKLIIKRNHKDITGADSYIAAGGASPRLPKDYEDFRTSLSRNSVQSEPSDLETESQVTSRDTSDQENSRESGGYVCAAGYTDDLDNSDAKEETMDTGISGADDTMTECDLSQSEDIMAVDSLLHSDLDIDEQTVSDNDEPIEISDFFSNAPDENQRAMLCGELSVLNDLDSDLVSPYGDDSRSSFSVDMPDIRCQSNTAIEGLLNNVPLNKITDPLGLNDQNRSDPLGMPVTNLKDPLGLNDPSSNGALFDEEASLSETEMEPTRPAEDFESALSSIASSSGADLSKPEAPVSVDSGLQSGGLDNSVEPLEHLESLDYLSDISDVEEEDLGGQMQNAIDSILSLQNFQNLSFRWPTTFASTQMTQPIVHDAFDGQSQVVDVDSSGSDNENDLDAAVQSIL